MAIVVVHDDEVKLCHMSYIIVSFKRSSNYKVLKGKYCKRSIIFFTKYLTIQTQFKKLSNPQNSKCVPVKIYSVVQLQLLYG